MPNQYFDYFNDVQMQNLYRDLIEQCVDMFGLNSSYIPRESQSKVDLIFGDDPTKKFGNSYPVVVMIENSNAFDGGDIFSKFGMTITKSVNLLIGANNFIEGTANTVGPRPREGDLIWLKPFQALYEITYVNQDKFFYAFGNKNFYGYSLGCEEFRYNNEVVDTGIDEIDDKIRTITTAYKAQMGSGNLTYQIGESVYQGPSFVEASATAEVISWHKPTGNLVLSQTVGIFVPNVNVIGLESNASFILQSVNVLDNVNDALDNNDQLRQEADNFVNFIPTNPFGDPTE
jgi:hypothetical protein